MRGRAQRRAPAVLDGVADAFREAGCRIERLGPLEARALPPDGPAVRLGFASTGWVFGGTFALEIATDEPVLPRTGGLLARGRGIVRWQGLRVRSRPGDEAGRVLARTLSTDRSLARALSDVHFERLRVEPDGRPMIRHMGGSLVWVRFPPIARPIPFVDEQAAATLAAMAAFARAGSRAR